MTRCNCNCRIARSPHFLEFAPRRSALTCGYFGFAAPRPPIVSENKLCTHCALYGVQCGDGDGGGERGLYEDSRVHRRTPHSTHTSRSNSRQGCNAFPRPPRATAIVLRLPPRYSPGAQPTGAAIVKSCTSKTNQHSPPSRRCS